MDAFSFTSLALIPLLPLAGAALLGLLGAQMDRSTVTVVALGSVLGAFLVTGVATWALVVHGPLEAQLWRWIDAGRFHFDVVLGFDALSATLMLVVTGVGFLIHVYSTGYMHDDPGYWRYFAYLNFFIFAMSVLVLGRSLPVMFVGWEGVGLASYLLIGFWYTDEEKAIAGKKAFIVNRVGDFGMLVGMMILAGLFGTLDFSELARLAPTAAHPGQVLESGIFAGLTAGSVITAACLALFLGATGKSAQIPLYVWLPDAMAGPTPVSALIHAATMVTAGVYMVCRLHALFDLSPIALDVIAAIGAATAVFAATIGLVQNDIKKVLAYSTVSQLGYMFLGVGVGAYSAAIFHLVTHAFFKACLFLGSGAVIHALHGEQDIRKMGGLKNELPAVYRTFAISTLAIAGVFPLSGFFSKDAIVGYALEHSLALGALGLAGAGLTAFYMARLTALTFLGGEVRHSDPHAAHRLHKPGASMTMPLWILAGLAVVAGALNLPHLSPVFSGFLDRALGPVLGHAREASSTSQEIVLMAASTGIALAGLAIGWGLYRDGPSPLMERWTRSGIMAALHALLENKYWVDELYQLIAVRPLRFAGSVFAMAVDPWVIDLVLVKLVGGVGVAGTGRLLRRPQNGNVQAYATLFVAAVAVVCLAVWKS